MKIHFDLKDKNKCSEADLQEKELNDKLTENWNLIFPDYIFIKSEFILKGDVRGINKSGRIDILGFNPLTKKFIIIEIKKAYDKNIRSQAFDYKDFIEDNILLIYTSLPDNIKQKICDFPQIKLDAEIILISNNFSVYDLRKIEKINETITLINYTFFSNNNLQFEYLEKTIKIPASLNSLTNGTNNCYIFWQIFFYLKDKEEIAPEIHYKIKDNKLIIALGKIYPIYSSFASLNYPKYLISKSLLVSYLTQMPEFINHQSSYRIDNRVTSIYSFNYNDLIAKIKNETIQTVH